MQDSGELSWWVSTFMKTLCKNGRVVERWYDRSTRSWITRVIDSEGNQIGGADYSGNKVCADFVKAIMIKDNGGLVK